MNKLLLAFLPSLFLAVPLCAQNTGIGTTSPQATLDVAGDIATRMASMSLANGTNDDVITSSDRRSIYRVVSPTADFSVTGLDGGVDGRTVTLINTTAFSMTMVNESVSSAAENRITTSNGNNITIPPKGAVTLQYSPSELRWFVTGISFTPLASAGGVWLANGADVYNNNTGRVGIGTPTPLAKLSVVGTSTWGTASFTGNNFTSHINIPESGLQNTYIRGGNNGANVILNDEAGLGNVGIGTKTPSSKLTVQGNTFISHTAMFTGGIIGFSGGGLSVSNTNGNGQTLNFDGSNIQSTYYGLGGYSYRPVVINPYGGNVGIGTNYSPTLAKLEIRIANESTGWSVSNGNFFAQAFLGGAGRSTNSEGVYLGTGGSIAGGGAAPLHFFTNGQWSQVTLLPNGNFGIGTTNPTYKLAVKGNIRSEEVIVETGWADYVFADGYRLKPLHEVARFIKDNKHLPNIPSAAEIEKNGLHLGDVQKKMMEKIEELTLYIIELKKEIDALKTGKE